MSESRKNGKITPFMKQCFVTGSVCMNVVSHGCVLGFPAVLLPQLHDPGSTIPLTPEAESWIVSIVSISMIVGPFLTPSIMDRFGRKVAHYAVTIPILVGWLTMVLAQNVEILVLGRILQGLSFGMFMPLRSAMLGEYTSPRNRGAFLTSISLAQGVGVLVVHLLGSLLSWSITSLICVFFSFLSLVMMIYAPESPSFLATKGRYDECRKAFKWLRGNEEDDELEELIRAQIQRKVNRLTIISRNNGVGILELIRKKEFYLPVVIMCHIHFMNQSSGSISSAAYSTKIIGILMGPSANAHFWMVALDTQRLITNTAAVYVMNKFNRRTMLLFAGLICILSHIAMAGYIHLRDLDKLIYDGMWIPVLLINLQFFSVAIGLVPLANVLAGEIFPLQYRSQLGSISVVIGSILMFAVLKTFPILIIHLGLDGTYSVYAIFLAYNVVVLWILLPETKGKTLQQIEDKARARSSNPEDEALRMTPSKDTEKQ